MIKFKSNSWHAKLYKLTNNCSELPSDFCSYFWSNILIILILGFLCPFSIYCIFYLCALIFFTFLLDISYALTMFIGAIVLVSLIIIPIFILVYIFNWCIKIEEFKEPIWWNNTKIIVKSWKDKVCPLIKWENINDI